MLGLAQCWGWVSEVVWFVMAVGCLGQSVCSFLWTLGNGLMSFRWFVVGV